MLGVVKGPSPWTCPSPPQHPWLPAGAYLESCCFRYLTPLLDSGTEGPRGNVLAMVPHLTKLLGPAAAPEDDTFPVCTLRYFPHTIQHTLQVGCATPAPAPSGKHRDLCLPFPFPGSGPRAGYGPSCFLLAAQALPLAAAPARPLPPPGLGLGGRDCGVPVLNTRSPSTVGP